MEAQITLENSGSESTTSLLTIPQSVIKILVILRGIAPTIIRVIATVVCIALAVYIYTIVRGMDSEFSFTIDAIQSVVTVLFILCIFPIWQGGWKGILDLLG